MKLFSHFKSSWRFQTQLQLATAFILIFIFSTITLTMLIRSNLENLLTLWGESQKVNVYLASEAPDKDVKAINEFLQKTDGIDKVKFISAQDSLKIFKDQLSVYAPDLSQDAEITKYIPNSFQFSIKGSAAHGKSDEFIDHIAEDLRKFASVEEISHGQEWFKNYLKFSQSLEYAIWFIATIIFLASIFIIANLIKSSIYSRREEIEILELIGATSWSIRLPYLIESGIYGFFTCSFSILLSYFIFQGLQDILKSQIVFFQLSNHIRFLQTSEICLILLAAIVGSLFSAYICVRKINTGWSAANRLREL